MKAKLSTKQLAAWLKKHNVYAWRSKHSSPPWTACIGTPGNGSNLVSEIETDGFRMLMDGRAAIGWTKMAVLHRLCRQKQLPAPEIEVRS